MKKEGAIHSAPQYQYDEQPVHLLSGTVVDRKTWQASQRRPFSAFRRIVANASLESTTEPGEMETVARA